MSPITAETVADLEAKEAQAKDAYRDAKDLADAARAAMGVQILAEAGVIIGETPCIVPEWGYLSHSTERVFVIRVNCNGGAVCAPITAKNKRHARKSVFNVEISKVKPEGQQ